MKRSKRDTTRICDLHSSSKKQARNQKMKNLMKNYSQTIH